MRGAELRDVATTIARGNFPRYTARADYDFGGFFGELLRDADDPAQMRRLFWDRLLPVERVRFIHDRPGKGGGFFSTNSRTTRELREILAEARQDVVVQSPYLILSGSARRMAKRLMKHYPELGIRISTNSYASTDNIMAYSANYRLRTDYVGKLGLQIHEFRPDPKVRAALFPQYDDLAARAEGAGLKRAPFMCLHAKSLVVDERVSFVGSYNLDPRLVSLNTEVGLVIEDETFARILRAEIERDMEPENSWVIAKREFPLAIGAVNGLIDDVISLTPLDLWPIQNSSSFELKPGFEPVSPGDPDFYRRYRDVGNFPGAESTLNSKGMLTRFYKTVGAVFTPIM